MLLSLNWLKDYLSKQDIKINAKDLAEKLTMRGLAVERISSGTRGLDNVVVGTIEKIEKHPDADRLQVTRVRVSNEPNAESLQIVCGAKNIAEGDIVPVALVGAILPGDLKIKKSKIRGVESSGMLCSGRELEISEDSDGILKLPKHSTIGQPLARLLGSDDVLLEFDLTANRGDCLSVMGLAREICPILKTRLREPKPPRFKNSNHRTSSIVKVEVEDKDMCPRYVARVIDTLKVTESPDWIKQRLKTVGIRPINNIVDITNFVMLEYGQPLHAFDLRRIESGGIKIGRCDKTMEFELLSGERVLLEPGDILIKDGDRPIALAGIMGGANTQIEDDTTSILLESACFDSTQIRKTAKRLNLHTDSSKRFERGIDVEGVNRASERAASLLRDSFEANVYHPPTDTNPEPAKPRSFAVDMRDIRRITGLYNLSPEKATDLLDSIGVPTHKRSTNIFIVKPPSFRNDLEKSIDIVEEVARLIGYDTIPERYPFSTAPFDTYHDPIYEFERKARTLLAQLGLRETIQYSFTSEATLIKYGAHTENLIKLQNPISEEFKVMRPSLLPSLLETYLYNKNRRSEGQRLFEVARSYEKDESNTETGAKETLWAAGLLSGNTLQESWRKNGEKIDFYYGKGLVDILVRQLSTVYLAYENSRDSKLLHPHRSACLKLGLNTVGYVGEVHPYIREQILETHDSVVLFELNLDALRKYERKGVHFKMPSRFPAVDIDIALVCDKSLTSQALIETIKSEGSELLESARVFDIYEGENIPMGKKSVAFHLSFVSKDRTLEENEVTELRDKIVKGLESKYSAQLRA
ncbi:MAG: phenylalanine--tRNA ligase subunit beta [Bdellovibrionales bacterium]|nr:phenylalanine--tRNA ligase subunit beta [Bdellovibrionales bacterium]